MSDRSLNLIVVVGVCAVLLWVLVTAIGTGEFSLENRITGSPSRSFSRLRRADNPAGFWILAVGHVAAIVYIASCVGVHAVTSSQPDAPIGSASLWFRFETRYTPERFQSGRSAAW